MLYLVWVFSILFLPINSDLIQCLFTYIQDPEMHDHVLVSRLRQRTLVATNILIILPALPEGRMNLRT